VSRADLEAALASALASLPAAIRPAAAAAQNDLTEYLVLLAARNEEMNLVSARAAEPATLVGVHLVDALAGLALLPPPRRAPLRLLDVGSGGGFPAIPILLVRRDVEGTLVDSVKKKCDFLEEAAARLALTARIRNARFPGSFEMADSGTFDVLTTRAVGSAGKLVRAARKLLSPRARAVLWTTGPLVAAAVRESRAGQAAFHPVQGTERRGILVLEGFTPGERST
jgi:16S rRNA (guanine527-N7)-methyltransferase